MGIYFCPEKKYEILLYFYDSNCKLVDFIKSFSISEVTFRTWLRKYHNEGFRGLCNDREWRERQEMFETKKFEISKLKCCSDYKYSFDVQNAINEDRLVFDCNDKSFTNKIYDK